MADRKIYYYLEKTFSQNPSDVAHLLKYLYYSVIRFDTKCWYYFTNHQWYRFDVDQSPLIPLIKNEVVNKYLSLTEYYNEQIKELTAELNIIRDENPEKMRTYLPLIRSDLMFKSKICFELGSKLIDHSFCQKVNQIAQELLTQKDFALTLDTNPHLIGFNNGILYLPNMRFDLPKSHNKVYMSVGYDFISENNFQKEVEDFFEKLGLTKALPIISSFLSGTYRQPVVWISGLNNESMEAISGLLESSLGEYCGSLPFSTLRKRKIPHYQNHTHTDLVNNCRRRLVIVEQTSEDYPSVNLSMIETLLGDKLKLRMPYEQTNEYDPQFGLLILSSKKDAEPMKESIVFEANEVEDINYKSEWKLDMIKLLLKYFKP